jgi:hypothetical protein
VQWWSGQLGLGVGRWWPGAVGLGLAARGPRRGGASRGQRGVRGVLERGLGNLQRWWRVAWPGGVGVREAWWLVRAVLAEAMQAGVGQVVQRRGEQGEALRGRRKLTKRLEKLARAEVPLGGAGSSENTRFFQI